MNSVKIGGRVARTYHHGALAEAMVDQALTEVRLRGADQVSLRGIAHALDVSPSAAYNHFAQKDDLLRAVGACGLAALDERMARVLAAHPALTAEAARARFVGLGRAYVAFALDETHLFQLTFGPICASKHVPPEEAGPYRKLVAALDDLNEWELLKPGIRPGLDVMVWAATHGMATLLVEGAVPPEGVDGFIESLSRLVLIDGVLSPEPSTAHKTKRVST
jgi:AcrR family transcriptional regulator